MTNNLIIVKYLLDHELTQYTKEYLGEIIPINFHTYAEWKRNGYQVKRGEKSQHKLQIWKMVHKKVKTEDNDGENKSENVESFVKTTASFFTIEQVEESK